jgi:hypothetical protein
MVAHPALLESWIFTHAPKRKEPETPILSLKATLLRARNPGSSMDSKMEVRRLLGLAALTVIYLCVGAAVFNAIEGRNEMKRKENLEVHIDNFLGE